MEHEFTSVIKRILKQHFANIAEEVFERSYLIRYLNHKTRSANSGSKARGSFGNHYAIYVLVEDYINRGFVDHEAEYYDYQGAIYTTLFARMRLLPFGQKLQNHALNNRMNEEFRKFFPDVQHQPIIRDLKTKRYEHLRTHAQAVYGIKMVVDRYIESIEEVINIPKIMNIFVEQVKSSSKLKEIMEEIVVQSRVEFNYE